MIPCTFHPDASAELEDAALFYEAQVPGLGKSFAVEIERTIAIVREYPEAGSPIGPGRRRVLVARFPYSIVYCESLERIVIVAVAHQRRRPGYWRQRG